MVKRRSRNVPEPNLQKTIFQARYQPHIRFYDLLLSAAQQFDAYPHWETDRLYIILHDYEQRCSLAIRHNNFSFEKDPGEPSSEGDCYLEEALEKLPTALDIPTYVRIGFRTIYLAPVKMTFEEVTAILNLKLFSQDEILLSILPPTVDDLMYRTIFSDSDQRFGITVGPVSKEEIPQRVSVNKKYHLDPKTREQAYLEIVERYPDTAILIDIDIFRQDDDIPCDAALPFLKVARERSSQLARALQNYLLELE